MTPSRQQGAVLAVGLILLLLMSLLGSITISRVNTSERLAGAERDRNSAFQAAESALLEGERWINDLTLATPPETVDECAGIDCQTAIWRGDGVDLVRNDGQSWSRIDWESKGRTMAHFDNNVAMKEIVEQPRYVIEYIGPQAAATPGAPDMHYYRITTRARGTTPNSEVILQSVFRREFP